MASPILRQQAKAMEISGCNKDLIVYGPQYFYIALSSINNIEHTALHISVLTHWHMIK